ncbi:MAG: hypothetical protein LBP53_02655 [Candidatus Peribacteria bacterium]|jgi:hypothetical protein|nr:hypothetical protein [Candidatus Peribacteria bacterium]
MGYHVPSYEEWKGIIKAGFDEGKWSGTPNGSFTSWNWDTIGLTEFQKTLKLPRSGTRHYSPPVVSYQNSYGDYWSSSLDTYPYGAKYLEFNENGG